MKELVKYIGILFAAVVLTTACETNPSLQKYYVDSKENNEFISIDLPASILQLKDTDVSEDVKKTLETIKKVNFLALQLTDSNQDLYTQEKEKVKKILKNPKYKELIRLNTEEGNVTVNYLGEEEAIDEVVVFGSDKNKGFALVRVIGENMNPSDILELTQSIKVDNNSNEWKQLEGILSSIN